MRKTELTAEIVRELLTYDPLAGSLTWKPRDSRWFSGKRPSHQCKVWNAQFGGKPAFMFLDREGYFRSRVLHVSLRAHQVAFLIMKGRWAVPEIDHINGVRHDNCWSNLREATRAQQCVNLSLASNNTSGCRGVSWHSADRKWQARIQVNRKKISFGRFDNYADACAARTAAGRKLFGGFDRLD